MVTRKDIKETANLTREEAVEVLNDLYREARAEGDRNAALAIRKELHRIHGLYKAPEPVEEESVESQVLVQIREHLEPLGLAPEGTDIVELVRLAALKVTEK